jgi:hypothetical protein
MAHDTPSPSEVEAFEFRKRAEQENSGSVMRSPDDAQFNAAPAPSLLERARNAISPIIGESRNQKSEREANLGQLKNISPQLASYVDEAIPEAQKAVQAHGVMPTVDTLTKMSGPLAGQMLGAETGAFAPIAIPVFGAIGGIGSDYLAQKRRIAYGEQDGLHLGELAQAGITGAIPGGALSKTGAGAVIGEAAKQGFGGLAGETTRSMIDEGHMPDVKNAAWASILPALGGAVAQRIQGLNPEIAAARTVAENQIAEKAGILAKGRAEGMVIPPSLVNPNPVNSALETIAGKTALKNQANRANIEVADDISRRILDPVNPDHELTSEFTKAVRQRAYDAGYKPIAAIGPIGTDAKYLGDLQNIAAKYTSAARSFPGAVSDDVTKTLSPLAVNAFDSEDAMNMVQILRNKASESFRKGDTSIGQVQRQAASAIESQIERELVASGTPQASDMLKNFRDARKLMAQSHEIEDSIREGGGSVIPSKFGARMQNQAPLSDGIETIGGMANNFPSVMRETAKIPAPTLGDKLKLPSIIGSTAGIATGAITHSPEAAALATMAGASTPGAQRLLRNLILSGPYQRVMAKIPVHVEANPDMGALIIRQGAQAVDAHDADNAQPTK